MTHPLSLDPRPSTETSVWERQAAWLGELRGEVEHHSAVQHPFLLGMRDGGLSRSDFRTFGEQHFALVGCFTKYMELLLLRAPSSEQKLWLAKVLVDEYGEGSEGKDHTTLYREYLVGLGAEAERLEDVRLRAEVWRFVGEHLRICREEPFLVGLGALGPGHEWAIPKMFSYVIGGLEGAGVTLEERLYFDLHTEQDVDHASWMAEALAKLARSEEERELVRRGARLSLEARYEFWSAVERSVQERRSGETGAGDGPGTLREMRAAVDAALTGTPWPVGR